MYANPAPGARLSRIFYHGHLSAARGEDGSESRGLYEQVPLVAGSDGYMLSHPRYGPGQRLCCPGGGQSNRGCSAQGQTVLSLQFFSPAG